MIIFSGGVWTTYRITYHIGWYLFFTDPKARALRRCHAVEVRRKGGVKQRWVAVSMAEFEGVCWMRFDTVQSTGKPTHPGDFSSWGVSGVFWVWFLDIFRVQIPYLTRWPWMSRVSISKTKQPSKQTNKQTIKQTTPPPIYFNQKCFLSTKKSPPFLVFGIFGMKIDVARRNLVVSMLCWAWVKLKVCVSLGEWSRWRARNRCCIWCFFFGGIW